MSESRARKLCRIGRRRLLWDSAALLVFGVTSAERAEAEPESGKTLADDVRLSALVQLHAEGIALGELLARIVGETHVALQAIAPLADEKVMVFGPSRPLRDVLGDVAHLLNAGWKASSTPGQGGGTWYLACSLSGADQEARLAAQATGGWVAASVRRLTQGLALSADALAKHPDAWVRQELTRNTPNARLGVRLLGGLTDAQCQTLMDARRFTVPFGALDAALQEEVGAFYHEQRVARAVAKPTEPLDTADNRDLLRYGVEFQIIEMHDGASAASVQGLPGEAGKWPPARRPTFISVEAGLTAREPVAEIDLPTPEDLWLLPARGNPHVRGGTVTPPLDVRQIQEAAQEKTWADRLRVLAEKTGLPVVSDFYRMRSRTPIADGKNHIGDDGADVTGALEAFCRPAGYLWWYQNGTLFFRKRDWYLQRLYEPSDRWLFSIAQALKTQKGVPTFGNVFGLGDLTRKQLTGLCGTHHLVNNSEDSAALGLTSLLALLGAQGFGDLPRPLPKFSHEPGFDVQALTRYYDAPTEERRTLLRWVMAYFGPYKGPEEGLARYGVRAWWGEFTDATQSTEWSPDWLRVEIVVELPDAKRVRFYQVYLPLTVPEDRRDKTVVRAVQRKAEQASG